MNTFDSKTRMRILERSDFRCECRGPGCMGNRCLAPHHIIPNTKANRKKYGNEVIQSMRNAVELCQHCHQEYYWQYTELREEKDV